MPFNLKDIRTEDFATTFFALLLFLSPGVLVLLYFYPEFFRSLDGLKVIIVSASISSPLFIINYLGIDNLTERITKQNKAAGPLIRVFIPCLLSGFALYISLGYSYLRHSSVVRFSWIALVVDVVMLLCLVTVMTRDLNKQKN